MEGIYSCAVLDFILLFLLILANGLFALSELAIVSSRVPRLRAMAQASKSGAESALALAAEPGKLLSAVQIGITSIGIVSGIYSGGVFGERLSHFFEGLGLAETWADPIGYGIVVVCITYLSVIIGELVPKKIALKNTEEIACVVAPFMTLFARVASPAVWFLDASTNIVFRFLGVREDTKSMVTDEEIKSLILEAENAGVLEKGEGAMISGVMRFADRAVVGLMTPRADVDWIDVSDSPEDIKTRLISTPHSRLPVGEGSQDAFIGVVQTRELLADVLSGKPFDVRSRVRKAPSIPEQTDALDVLKILRESDVPMALVHDEYGTFEGLVTPADIIEAIAGVFKSDSDGADPHAVERPDGSWLLSGAMAVDEMAALISIPLPKRRGYETVAGFVLSELLHVPKVGESVEISGWRFEVVDIDGRRIDKVLATRVRTPRRQG